MFVKSYYPAKRRNQNNLDNFLNDFFTDVDKSFKRPAGTGFFRNRPAVNVWETDESFQIEIAAPGLSKEDIKIDLDGEILKISATKATENSEKEEKKYSIREFNFTNFERSFTLPETVDNQAISAKFENGILMLVLSKREEAKPVPPRTIAIS